MSKEIETKKTQKKWFKVIQIFMAYLVAAWTFLQFVDWVVNRYEISTNWVDVWLWIFIGIIPSLLIYIYNQERLNSGFLRWREKIIFPLNVVLLIIGLYFGFATSDLGATTRKVQYVNEDGTVLTRELTKDEFRIGLPIFNFEQTNKDSATLWLERGIRDLLYYDIHQDKNVNPARNYSESTTEKVEQANMFNDFYVDGTYFFQDDLYTVEPNLRKAKNGKLVSTKSFKGPELSILLDSISIYLRQEVGISEKRRERYIDLNIQEFTSDSFEAIEYFVKGKHEEAIALDSSFALAYLSKAARNIWFSQGKFEERFIIDKAFENRLKLPEDRQLQILIYKHIAYEDWQKAEELVNLQLEIEPNNDVYIRLLYVIYSKTNQFEAYLKFAKKEFEKEFNEFTGINYLNGLLINGKYKECVEELDKYLFLNPNDKMAFFFKLAPLLLNNDFKEARAIFKKAQVLHPDWENILKVYDSVLTYGEGNPSSSNDLSYFEGEFRVLRNEQIRRFSLQDDVLIHSASNQDMWPAIISGKRNIVTFHGPLNLTTADYMLDDDDDVYAINFWEVSISRSFNLFLFKLDPFIKEAESLLINGKLDRAEKAYLKAIEHNPRHFYLKDALAHIQYLKKTDSLQLQEQFKRVAGEYGPRKFWIDHGKLYYKRSGKANLPRIRLLPISETTYINLTRLRDRAEFELKDGWANASYFWQYNSERNDWIKLDDDNNYFEKD